MKVTSSAYERYELVGSAVELVKNAIEIPSPHPYNVSIGMNKMASGAHQVNAAVDHVNEICGKNRKAVDTLIREVSRFKVE